MTGCHRRIQDEGMLWVGVEDVVAVAFFNFLVKIYPVFDK